jgi:diketogulonate reductase-like aldo/keto reductase
VLDKRIEKKLLPLCIENKITIQAYTPIEKGAVSRNKTIIEISSRYRKTPIQVSLNYLISRPRVTAIPKTEKIERVREFKNSMGWRLEAKDIEILEKL